MIQRNLEDQDKDASTYFVDAKGDAYEPYSLAWRYLGMYLDCDLPDQDGSDESSASSGNYGNVNRKLADGDQEENECSRRILWAAYYDPGYKGGSIGEYQFYDWQNGVWDKSTCQTKRCARMDCHEPTTHFKLIGVFKETDGLADWAEQLFKHQGYCLWDQEDDEGNQNEEEEKESGSGDEDNEVYDSMDGFRQNWPAECSQMYLTDYDGNDLYVEAKPQSEGNMTYGIYLDEACSQESSMEYPEYVKLYFEYYYGYEDEKSLKAAAYWSAKFAEWNYWMTSFKVCNPCRAYSRVPTSSQDKDNKRFLNEDDNGEDGEGEEEPFGYNCYDAAGYTNCNQCYKFETKTDLEPATIEDLERASAQGSILAVKVDGHVYGQGYVSITATTEQKVTRFFLVLGVLALLGFWLYLRRAWLIKLLSGRKQSIDALETSFGETLCKPDDDETVKSDQPEASAHTEEEYHEKEIEVESLKHQISQQKVLHQLERLRKDEYIKQLEKRIESKEVLEEAAKEASLIYSS